jgi:hypothetical protein
MGTMNVPVDDVDVLRSADVPVMVYGWAEAVIDLGRWQSRRRHPSNQEPTWEKDGGYETIEWVI